MNIFTIIFGVLALLYALLLGIALRRRADRTPEKWLYAHVGFSIVLMAMHAVLLSNGIQLSGPITPGLLTIVGLFVSLTIYIFLTISYLGYNPSPVWALLGLIPTGVVGGLVMQGGQGLLAGQPWLPSSGADDLSLGVELTIILWLFVNLALLILVIREYLSEPRPLYANRILFWSVATPTVLLGDALTAWVSNPPFNAVGAALRIVGVAAAVYAVGASRIFDFRDLTRRVISRVVLTIVLTAIIYGSILLTINGSWVLLDWAIGLFIALGAGILIQPIYQFLTWALRGLLGRDIADAAETVREYSQQISGVIDIRELATVAIETMEDLLQARGGYLLIATQFDESVILEAIGSDSDGQSGLLMLDSPVYHHFIETGRPLLQYDIEYQREYRSVSQTERAYISRLAMDVFAPIVQDGELLGLLALGPKINDEPYRDAELDLLAALANQTVAALENARLVADLEVRNTEVSALNENLRESNERLERMDAVKSDFIDIASHELRTPLTQIKGYTALLLEMSERNMLSPSDTIDIMRSLNGASDRMGEVIAAMLDVSQIDVESLDLNFIETTIANVVKLSIEAYSEAIHERNLTLVARGLRNLPAIYADYQRLTQAFQNVITNSIKFTPDGGKINITGEVHERDSTGEPLSVRISFQDTGIGIDPEHHEMIFDKFYRVGSVALHSTGTTKFMGAGPGLGLPISKGIIDAHGGRIWVTSEGHDEEKLPGTTFNVVLPVRPPAMYAKERMLALKEDAESSETATVITKSPFFDTDTE